MDRYQALGIPHPDPATVCQGPCEGTGVFPLYNPEGDMRTGNNMRPAEPDPDLPAYREAWAAAHSASEHDCDGWHFVRCVDCAGTGKRSAEATDPAR